MHGPDENIRENIHATALLVADRGVLISGASGTGKSGLALALINARLLSGGFAALVSDDRTILRAANGRLLASAPETLAGGIEVRGAGLFCMAHEKQAVIHLVVDLVSAIEAVRYPDEAKRTLCGVTLPRLALPSLASAEANILMACQAIAAALFMQPWPHA
ncbi:HPr kinase/phosphorylase [Phyllobacterium leguminum]|nr:HPr kinase/phosphatase C-terminal domain-containing protein [Phyllobacterium leguminum]